MLEKQIQSRIVKYLSEKGIYYVKIITAGNAGHPDIIACVKGKFVAIEVKSEKGKHSPLQIYRQKQIENNGGLYILAHSVKDINF